MSNLDQEFTDAHDISHLNACDTSNDCLVIKNDGIGDLVVSAGVISGLHKLFPDGVDLVTCIENKEVAERIPNLRRIFYLSRDSMRIRYFHAILGLKRYSIPTNDKAALDRIAAHTYHTAICLRRFVRQSTLIAMQFVSAKQKWSFAQFPTNASKWQFDEFSSGWEKGAAFNEVKYERAYYIACLQEKMPGFRAVENDFFADGLQVDQHDKKLLVNLSGSSSRAPDTIWSDLTDLAITHGFEVSLIGANSELSIAREIEEKHPLKVTNKCGLLSIPDSLTWMSMHSHYIGNDTGLSHLANTICPETLVLMGGGTFNRFWTNANKKTG